jgi:hypothetical protein
LVDGGVDEFEFGTVSGFAPDFADGSDLDGRWGRTCGL